MQSAIRPHAFDQLNGACNNLDAAINNAANDSQSRAYLDAAKNQILDHFINRRAVVSASATGQWLITVGNELPAVAAFAYGQILQLQFNSALAEAAKGRILAVAFEAGLQGVSDSERSALGEVRKEIDATLAILRDTAATLSGQYQQLASDVSSAKASQAASFETDQEFRKSNYGDLLEKSTADLLKLKTTYDEQLALRGPVTYWTRKANAHRIAGTWWGITSGLAAAAIAVLTWIVPHQLAAPVNNGSPRLEVWEIGLLVVMGTLAFWLLRVLVRLTLSNVHLATDSRMRATMMTAYLSMLRRGNLDEKERRLILEVLFRPSITGLIKDEAAPPGLWDVLSRVVSK